MSPTQEQKPSAYALFHCNLAFSSIEEDSRKAVIETCYWPLLRLAENNSFLPAIEMTAFTLECVQALDPKWIDYFRLLLERGKCELICSGDSQIVGPLVPARVNEWNLQLGQEAYRSILGRQPQIAYVNEQAVSSGLVDIYIDLGYRALVVEWDNLFSHNPGWKEDLIQHPQRLKGLSGRSIPVLWNWSIAFQKLQRVCHGQISSDEYFDFIQKALQMGIMSLPVYGNDAEIFDYRPGRFDEEAAALERSEWTVLAQVFSKLSKLISWKTPTQILDSTPNMLVLDGFTAENPISVKKQMKYNLTRWCLSGRNDLLLNSICHRRFAGLNQINIDEVRDTQKKDLCRLWASDFRTHLTHDRYSSLMSTLNQESKSIHKGLDLSDFRPCNLEDFKTVTENEAGTHLKVNFGGISLSLNLLRGGAVRELAFASASPILGTIEHGDRRHIALAADFYSNHTLAELVTERKRITDLGKSSFQLFSSEKSLLVVIRAPFGKSSLTKTYRLHLDGKLHCGFYFDRAFRLFGTLRLGFLTFLSRKINYLGYSCHNGGHGLESFRLSKPLHHGQAVSSLISASGCLGATEGELYLHDGSQGLRISWLPGNCAAMPMIQREFFGDEQLNRVFFSLAEMDETFCDGGTVLNFEYTLEQNNHWPEMLGKGDKSGPIS